MSIDEARQKSHIMALQMEVLAELPSVKKFLELLEFKRLNDQWILARVAQTESKESKK